MTNDRALRLGRGRNVIMCKKLALGFVAATLVCSATVAQEVTLRGVTAFAEKTTYSRGFEKFIERVNAELGTTTAVITHNAAVAAMANRVVSLADGRIVSEQRNPRKQPARDLRW